MNPELPYNTTCKPFFTELLIEQKLLQFNGTNDNITYLEIGERITKVINGLFKIEQIFNNNKFQSIANELRLLEVSVKSNLKWPYPVKNAVNLKMDYKLVNEFYILYNNSKDEYSIEHNCSEKALEKVLQYSWSDCFLQLGNAIGQYGLKLPKVVIKSFDEIQYKYNVLDIFISEFNEINKINNDFFLKNFAKVDVFYKEMNYQKITQQEKFGFLSLLSEVGGFMGLVLGASVITIIEFIEFIAYTIIQKISEKIKRNNKLENIHYENT
ncbi:DgyrCDS14580 [Dimorphilus gyrociliatus]|uniref:DgyrCDS14580 n=1 Tax=Dimorphilus gyrociliatus TaxID=2664684 RepID=A0A7I8WE38_9ANNE|nr:DgyrCDS14580 [Dimorphilus gyrociliatus]